MRAKNNALYTRIIETSAESLPEIERHEEFLKALSIASPEVVPVIRIQEADRVVADRILAQHGISPEGLVVLGSHTSGHYKNYPYWSDVLADVCQEQGLVVVAVGGDKDRFAVQEILDRLPVKSLNLCGQTSLMESAAIISRAKIVVASDTSIPHIASALGVPNVVVVGGGHFGRFFPYSKSTSMVCLPLDCYGCEWRCKYSSPHCVKSVDPQVVAEAVRFTLEGTGAKPRVFMQTSSVKLVEPHTAPPRWKPFYALLNPEKLELVLVSVAGRSDMVSSIGRSLHTQTAVGQISEIN
jgi:ADP-heptose:LPS heptosyltransferase